ncbi:MAG: hypothetical protein QM695_15955 [Micropruina sp.]
MSTLTNTLAVTIPDPGRLAEAAKWVARILGGKAMIPVLQGIKLTATDGVLRLSAFDFENSAETEVPAEIITAGEALIPGRVFAELAATKITRIEADGSDLVIAAGRAKVRLRTLNLTEYPSVPEPPVPTHTIDNAALASAVARLAPLRDAESEKGNPAFAGVDLRADGDWLILRGGCRYVIAEVLIPIEGDGALAALPPMRIVGELTKGVSGRAGIATPHESIALTVGERVSTMRCLAVEMPDLSKVLDAHTGSSTKVKTGDLLAALGHTAMFSDRARLDLTPDRIVVSTATPIGKGYAEAESSLDIAAESDDSRSVVVHIDRFMAALRVPDHPEIVIGFNATGRPLLAISHPESTARASFMAIDPQRATGR